MKWLVFSCLFFFSTYLYAQQKLADSTINIDLPALNLTPELHRKPFQKLSGKISTSEIRMMH
jgi:hypothetical protein